MCVACTAERDEWTDEASARREKNRGVDPWFVLDRLGFQPKLEPDVIVKTGFVFSRSPLFVGNGSCGSRFFPPQHGAELQA